METQLPSESSGFIEASSTSSAALIKAHGTSVITPCRSSTSSSSEDSDFKNERCRCCTSMYCKKLTRKRLPITKWLPK